MPRPKIGPAIRTRLGRWEVPAADAYRSVFINLNDCAEVIASAWEAKRILEVGCGDGSFAQRLLDRYPEATYMGIDISAEPGRLFQGDAQRAEFRRVDSGSYLSEKPEPFDLVVVVDVLHHVPLELRSAVLRDIRDLTKPGGVYAIKEWNRSRNLTHLACWAADKFITGDDISHLNADDLKVQLSQSHGDELLLEARVPPHRNNYLLGYRRS